MSSLNNSAAAPTVRSRRDAGAPGLMSEARRLPGGALLDLQCLNGKTFDFLVIGGGITGAGVAQDAASRGYSTLVIDKGDFASGTSSKSTKLIHGGLRYLANFQIQVTRESLSERRMQLKLAPHMVWSLPFVIPCYKGNFFKNLKLRLGLIAYDLLAGFGNKFRHRGISAAEVLQYCPGVKREGLTGGLLYYDCRTDDARHVLEVILSAVQHGALAVNYLSMRKSLKNKQGRLIGAELRDELSGKTVNVFARQIVNATGVWTQETCKKAAAQFEGELVPSKGIHICVSRQRMPIESAMIIPSVHDSRFLFAVPWYEQVIIGTTDTDYKGDIEKPAVEPEEERYILDSVNRMFPNLLLTSEDVSGRYAGLRPLVKTADVKKTADLSRQHSLKVSPEGLISISGGKLTTYRLMAKETVDFAQKEMHQDPSIDLVQDRVLLLKGRRASLALARAQASLRVPCRTENLVLGGFSKNDSIEGFKRRFRQKALALGLFADTANYLVMAYGKRSEKVLELVKARPELAERLADGHPYILAQVLYAIRFEAACTLQDVLSMRIRLAILDSRAARGAAHKACAVMAREHRWKADEMEPRLQAFFQEVE